MTTMTQPQPPPDNETDNDDLKLGRIIQITLAKQPFNVFETQQMQVVFQLISKTMSQTTDRICVIHGDPGVGKTCISRAMAEIIPTSSLAQNGVAIHITAYNKMSVLGLLQSISAALGLSIKGSRHAMYLKLQQVVTPSTFIFLDEADGLSVEHFEVLRWLSDECGALIAIFGTTDLLLGKVLNDPRGKVVADRLLSRINTRQHLLTPLTEVMIGKYVLAPAGIRATKRNRALILSLTKGNWRQCNDLVTHAVRLAAQESTETGIEIPKKDGNLVIDDKYFTGASRESTLARQGV